MLAYLKGKKDPDYSFTNEVNLEKSLWQYLEREFDFLHELFRKPSILAEAVIHSGRLERQGATMEDLKPLLREFFDGDTMVLKRLINIFQLDILDVFQKAFRELPLVEETLYVSWGAIRFLERKLQRYELLYQGEKAGSE
jgi:hypothetical protein